jgi:hypothetical protein
MYEQRSGVDRAESLDQGDILQKALLPTLATDKSFGQRNKNALDPATPDHVKAADDKLRVFGTVKHFPYVVVLSASCDNIKGLPLELAPVVPWDLSKAPSDSDRWKMISALGTGAGNLRSFYMPADPTFGFGRSKLALDQRVFVDPTFVTRCIAEHGTKRIGALNALAVRHLQWTLGASYSRNARDDLSWPSEEDLRLKATFLEAELKAGTPFKSEYEAELLAIQQLLTPKVAG